MWPVPRRTTPVGQPVYSDYAIEMWLTLRMVFRQALRQTRGLMRSISKRMRLDTTVPHFTIMSRRGNGLSLAPKTASETTKPVQLFVDSTGLQIFGEGEWLEEKHTTKSKRRAWRNLHLGLELVSGEIVCSELTTDDIGDPNLLPGLLDQIGGPVEKFLADGAYDGVPTVRGLNEYFGPLIEVTIPTPKNAVVSVVVAQKPRIRDQHVAEIEAHCRMAWQKSSGYNQHSRIKTQIGR